MAVCANVYTFPEMRYYFLSLEVLCWLLSVILVLGGKSTACSLSRLPVMSSGGDGSLMTFS